MIAILFLDSSALVKRYAVEADTPQILKVLKPTTGNIVFVAKIAGAEVVAALARKKKGGFLSQDDAAKAIRRFRSHFALRYQKTPINDTVIGAAMQYAETYALRGYDAVQLAAAVELQKELTRAGKLQLEFISFDKDLNVAAHQEGLLV